MTVPSDTVQALGPSPEKRPWRTPIVITPARLSETAKSEYPAETSIFGGTPPLGPS